MKIAAFVSVLALSLASSAFADSWTVNSTRDAVDHMPGDGICATSTPLAGGGAECTLRAAVHEANARRFALPRYHQIYLPAGVYRLTIPPDPLEEENQFVSFVDIDEAVRQGDLDIYNNIGITGAGAATVIEALGADRVFDVWNHFRHQVGFQQLTIQGGGTSGPGGCIYHRGGGLELSLTDITIQNCISRDQVGGGLYNAGFTQMLRARFINNTALRGGGFENGSVAMIDESTFDDNQTSPSPFAAPGGGGISNLTTHGEAPWFTMRNSTVSNNSSETGGGILNHGSVTIINSTISGNRAGRGAGIAFFSALTPEGAGTENIYMLYSTVANNQGVGIMSRTDGRISVSHSIFAGNRGPLDANCDARFTESDHNLESGHDCLLVGDGDMGGVDPLLGPLAANGGPTLTHALLGGSPAIDAGVPPARASQSRDQRGTDRPLGAATDIGAFEYGIDPDGLMMLIPIPWEWLFEGELAGTIELTIRFSLSLPDKKHDAGRIVGIKAADGQGPLSYQLAKRGRSLRVKGLAAPPKPGGQNSPALFYLAVQRSLDQKMKLQVTKAACKKCGVKPAKNKPIVIPPFKPKGK